MAAKKPTKTTTKSRSSSKTPKTSAPVTAKRVTQNTSPPSQNNWFSYSTSTGPANYTPTSKEKGYSYNLRADYVSPKPEKEPSFTTQRPDMKVIRGESKNTKKEGPPLYKEIDNFVDYAITKGILDFTNRNPEMQKSKDHLRKYINRDSTRDIFEQVYRYARVKGKVSREEAMNIAYSKVREYIGGGELFDNRGKKILLRGELEKKLEAQEKGLMFRLLHHNQIKGRKYMNKAMDAFDDLNVLMKTGNYNERMPEITKALDTLYNLQFLEPAIEVLKEYNLISGWKYSTLKKGIYRKAKEEAKTMIGGVEKYVLPKAAAVIGLAGLL